MYCYNAMANSYAEKVKAALWILRFKHSNDVADLDKALPFLKSSYAFYADLVKLTENDYLYANSMQTKQRKIPMRGVDKTFITWKEMLPVFEKELKHFERSIDSLKSTGSGQLAKIVPYKSATVQLLSGTEGYYSLNVGKSVFTDTIAKVKEMTAQLAGLQAIAVSKAAQIEVGTTIKFSTKAPVKLLIGYFNKKDSTYLAAPQLETDASANNYGQAEIKISNGIVVEGFPPVNVHAYSFGAGTHTLTLGKGACLILGFLDDRQELRIFNAGLDGNGKDIDWLFE